MAVAVMPRSPAAAAAAAALPALLAVLVCFRPSLAGVTEGAEEEAASAAATWQGLDTTSEQVWDATVFLQTSLVTAHRSPSTRLSSTAVASKAAAKVPDSTEMATAASADQEASAGNAAQTLAEAASSAAPLRKPTDVVMTTGSPNSADNAAAAAAVSAMQAAVTPAPLSFPLLSGSSGTTNLGIRFFGGSPDNPSTPAERQKKELVVLLLASVVLQILLLKISARMAENSGGKQKLDDILMRTDFNQG